MHILSYD